MNQVEIITIGDEILIGQVVDTNSAWMAVALNQAGFEVAQITSVHDSEHHILSALESALQRADIVLLTGGLGPTKDDITKQTLCTFFDSELVYDESVYRTITTLLRHKKIAINELTAAQAMVPACCEVIQNVAGTAPVMWFTHNTKVVVSMPGVPYEMKVVMETEVIPRMKTRFATPIVRHKTTLVYGIPESALALRIAEWESALPEYLHLAYLPHLGIVKLRLSGTHADMAFLEREMTYRLSLLYPLIQEAIVAHEEVSLHKLAGDLLRLHGSTIATAESCTGGYLAHLFTQESGSSDFYKGGVVAYANQVKTDQLGVDATTIGQHGAVSKPVVELMAEGVRTRMQTDYAIATSGIAGPTGGTAEKPVGTVWIALATPEKTLSECAVFGTDRFRNIERSAQAALVLLIQELKNTPYSTTAPSREN